jgi:DNA-binding response OmpR family regulator
MKKEKAMADAVRKGPAAATCHRAGGSASEFPSGGPDKVVTVLAISPLEDDHRFLHSIFSHSKWQLRDALTWNDARQALQEEPAPVVICESVLPDAHWTEVLAQLSALPGPPLLIVSSRMADDRLWAEVLNLGGYDVLAKPFEAAEVFRVISLAWLSWKNSRDRATRDSAGFARAVAG